MLRQRAVLAWAAACGTAVLTTCAHAAVAQCVPITVVEQPANPAVLNGCQATLQVKASGTPPLAFLWFRNDVPIANATNAAYTLPPVTIQEDGAIYFASISNGCSDEESARATVHVVLNALPPRLLAVRAGQTPDKVILSFATACGGPGGGLDPARANDRLNYVLSSGLVVSNAELSCNGTNVILSTSRLTEGSTTTVIVNALQDTLGNTIAANSTASFRAAALVRGLLLREVFSRLPGPTLPALTNQPVFPNCPDSAGFVRSFEAPRLAGNWYGQRLSGYLLPPLTTNYVFWIASADQSALFLSPDDNPGSRSLIAVVASATGFRDWGCASNPPCGGVSAAIPLEAGKRYYIEALMKQDIDADHLSVAWQMAGAARPLAGSGVIPGTYLATYGPANAVLTITQNPVSVTSTPGCRATFATSVTLTPSNTPVSYQWQRNSVDIPGANAATYVTGPLTLTDNFTVYRCMIRAPGINRPTGNAVLSVSGDVAPLKLRGVLAPTPQTVLAAFTTPLPSVPPAANHFTIAGVPAAGVLFVDDSRTILEIIPGANAPLAVGAGYDLAVSNVQDASGTGITPNPAVERFTVYGAMSASDGANVRFLPGRNWSGIQWSGPGILESAPDASGPWQELSDAVSPHWILLQPGLCDATTIKPGQFYRVRRGSVPVF